MWVVSEDLAYRFNDGNGFSGARAGIKAIDKIDDLERNVTLTVQRLQRARNRLGELEWTGLLGVEAHWSQSFCYTGSKTHFDSKAYDPSEDDVVRGREHALP